MWRHQPNEANQPEEATAAAVTRLAAAVITPRALEIDRPIVRAVSSPQDKASKDEKQATALKYPTQDMGHCSITASFCR